mmetsp:Transcript_15153/g.17025  ORF Transcript_15153/g.17025 Transcript_15153/m.17025 type:complete len:237 (-) Transcript_15153:145-855(-)
MNNKKKVETSSGDNSNSTTTSNFCAEMIMFPAVCQRSSNFAEHMDIFMACRHPLDLLGTMFHEDDEIVGSNTAASAYVIEGGGGDHAENNNHHQVSGYHAIPRTCEYCGRNIDSCHENTKCERPKSFFPKEKPPFYSPSDGSKWSIEKNIRVSINNDVADDVTDANVIVNADVNADVSADDTIINEDKIVDVCRSEEEKFPKDDETSKIIEKTATTATNTSITTTSTSVTRRLAWI